MVMSNQPQPDFIHEPLKHVRIDTPGEAIFVSLWQQVMAQPVEQHSRIVMEPETKLGEIMMYSPVTVTQRTASICAEFCRYLGTNGGRSFAYMIDEQLKVQKTRKFAVVTAWALENERCFGINDGKRTIEFLLSTVWGETADSYSYADTETIDAMIAWLGTNEGRDFLIQGFKLVKEAHAKIRQDQLEAFWAAHHADESLAPQPGGIQ